MNSTPVQLSDSPNFREWTLKGLTEEQILDELNKIGLDSSGALETLGLYRKFKNEKRQNTGFILSGLGAFIGFLSCVFTMLDLDPSLRGFMLYGLTSIGLVFIFAGLFLVFE